MPTKQFKITSSNFLYIIDQLKSLSRDTLDRGRILNDEEYLEAAKYILDRVSECGAALDYTEAEKRFRLNRSIISEVKEWMRVR